MTTRPPGRTTRRHLSQAPIYLGEVTHPETDRGGVEGIVLVRQRKRIAPLEAQLGAHRLCLYTRPLEHRLGEIAAHDLPSRAHPPGQLERQLAGTGGDIQHPIAGADPARSTARIRQLVIQAGGHDGVQQVIDTAMRSNIARTCPASSVPADGSMDAPGHSAL